MSKNIQTTNFVSNINGADFNLAFLVTAWSNIDYNGNRILSSAGSGAYYFPGLYQGFTSVNYGQVVTVFNQSNSNNLTINTGNMNVRFDNTTYGTFQTFTIPRLTIVRFVLLYGVFYVQTGRDSM